MKTTNLTLSLVLFLSFLFSSPLTYGQTTGSGTVTLQSRDVGAFTKIEAGSAFTLIVEQGAETMVIVETDDNYQDRIETVVKGDRLTISSMGMQSPSAMKVRVTSPVIEEINMYGAARLSSVGTIKGNQLRLELSGASRATLALDVQILISEISGAAKVTLNGSAIKHNADISGAVNLNALSLSTITTTIDLSGASKASINSTSNINAEISGASSLSYYDDGKLNRLSKPGTYEITPVNPSEKVAQLPDGENDSTISGDSTIIRIGGVSVEVKEGNPTRITIGGNELEVDDNGNVKFKRNKQTKYNGHWAGFELGVNGYVNNNGEFDLPEDYDFLDLRMGKSINVKLNFWEQNFNVISNKLGFTTGLGFEWVNYRFANDVFLRKEGNDIINNSIMGQTKSKMVVNYLNLPLMLEYQTNRHSNSNSFHIGVGIQTGLRIGAHTKRVYQDDGRNKKDKDPGDYHINPFKYDAMVRIGWGKLNLHANYSLNSLFKNNRGPELYPFSVGLTLVSW